MNFSLQLTNDVFYPPNHKTYFSFALGCPQDFNFPIQIRRFSPVSTRPHQNCRVKLKSCGHPRAKLKYVLWFGDLMASHWANPQENQFITHHLREPPICNVVLLETFTNTYSNSLNFMGKLMLTIAAADSLPDWLLLLDPNDASCLHTNFVGPV